jgi:hypothetical protein
VTTVPPPPRHERTRQVAIRLGAFALIVPALVFTGSSRDIAAGSARHPSQSIAPRTATSRCMAPGRAVHQRCALSGNDLQTGRQIAGSPNREER